VTTDEPDEARSAGLRVVIAAVVFTPLLVWVFCTWGRESGSVYPALIGAAFAIATAWRLGEPRPGRGGHAGDPLAPAPP
jgi:hypothetical protein